MHELSIAQSILEIAEQQVVANQALRVLSIRLRIGELSAIVPDALRFSFDIVSKDTHVEGAVLEIEQVPWRVRCSSCQNEYQVKEADLQCPACNTTGGETISGRELLVLEMNIE